MNMKNKQPIFIQAILRIIFVVTFLLLGYFLIINLSTKQNLEKEFNKEFAFQHIKDQLEFGPRYPGSEGHAQVQEYIVENMEKYGWDVNIQLGEVNGHLIKNIICNKGSGESKILIGAHYDTREFASMEDDPESLKQPVPGANDGASGVAVMLELARIIPDDFENEVVFVYFDQEDNGGINGANWAMGSWYYVENLEKDLDAVVIIDMIGDRDLQIYREKNSSIQLINEIWETAQELGFDEFINQERFSMLDDHSAFINHGMNAILIIDFLYPAWHLTEDTLDKVSGDSLKIVGDTILAWMKKDISNE